MQCAVEKFVQSKENGLCLIDMPTGAGKTYLTRQIIGKFIRGEILTDIETIIYLTPQKKNIDDIYDKLQEDFKDNPSLFDSNVLRIYANYECVINRFLDLYEKFPTYIKNWESCKELKKRIECYKDLEEKNFSKEIIETTLSEIRKTYEVAFRKDLSEDLYKERRTLKLRKSRINSNEYSWIKDLYPACLTSDRSVLFMTMDKFFAGNDPIISKSYRFISHSKTKGALIFIDEFDATKDVLLNQEIQNSKDYKMDLIKLFSSISNTLKGREFPVSIFADSLDEDDKNSSLSRFKKMKAHFLEVEKKFNLNYLFKLDTKGETDRYFLFDDYQLHTITNSKTDKNIVLCIDKKKRKNTITLSEQSDEGVFYRTIYAIKNAINMFIGCSSQMAKNYLNYYNDNARATKSDMMELEQAVSTIIDPYNLDYVLAKNLCAMIVDNIAIPIINKGRDVFDTDFYMNGFRYYDFKDDISHNESTTMMMCYLENTPEKYMLSLASKARVVGLSATASIETVTGNYNIEYLKDRLNDGYYELSRGNKDRINAYIVSRLNNSNNINVCMETINDDIGEIESIIAQVFTNVGNIELFSGILEKYQQQTDRINQDPFFEIKRVIRAMKAIKSFLLKGSSKAMLLMTNKNVKEDGTYDVFSSEVLEKMVEAICSEEGIVVPHLYYLQSARFSELKESYKQAVQTGERVILFSSYQTAGTGQNLQYEIDEQERDIDTLYIEYPRNIIVNMSRLKDEIDAIKLVYQYETLKTSGEISKDVSLKNIKSAFRKLMNSHVSDRYDGFAYATDSVNNHIVKILIQAVGRICRTRNKNEEINIFVDEEIIKNVNFSVAISNGRILNPEFEKIVRLGDHIEKEAAKTHKNLNITCDRNARVKTRIENMLNENRTLWSDSGIEQWEYMRDFVLKHPTISREILDAEIKGHYSVRDFYLEAQEGRKIDHYLYCKDGEEGKQIIYDFNNPKGKYITIDAQGTRLTSLVRIPSVKKAFQDEGYAMSFERDDYIILPVVYQNIYKGALGEVAGKAILEQKGIKLKHIADSTKFEKFDYCLQDNESIYIDFKNWSEQDAVPIEQYRKKCFDKLQKIGGKKVFVINVAASHFAIHTSYDGAVIEISTLCSYRNGGACLYELDSDNMNDIITILSEAIYGDK